MKVLFKKITQCDECPYFRHVDGDPNYENECWYECSFTDKILINDMDLRIYEEHDKFTWTFPEWCPLEDYELFHKAIEIVRENADKALR